MAPSKAPDSDAAVTVTLPDAPEAMVNDVGSVPKVKGVFPAEPPPHIGVNFTGPEIWLAILGFPTAFTYKT
jgi:hypothetical protein